VVLNTYRRLEPTLRIHGGTLPFRHTPSRRGVKMTNIFRGFPRVEQMWNSKHNSMPSINTCQYTNIKIKFLLQCTFQYYQNSAIKKPFHNKYQTPSQIPLSLCSSSRWHTQQLYFSSTLSSSLPNDLIAGAITQCIQLQAQVMLGTLDLCHIWEECARKSLYFCNKSGKDIAIRLFTQ